MIAVTSNHKCLLSLTTTNQSLINPHEPPSNPRQPLIAVVHSVMWQAVSEASNSTVLRTLKWRSQRTGSNGVGGPPCLPLVVCFTSKEWLNVVTGLVNTGTSRYGWEPGGTIILAISDVIMVYISIGGRPSCLYVFEGKPSTSFGPIGVGSLIWISVWYLGFSGSPCSSGPSCLPISWGYASIVTILRIVQYRHSKDCDDNVQASTFFGDDCNHWWKCRLSKWGSHDSLHSARPQTWNWHAQAEWLISLGYALLLHVPRAMVYIVHMGVSPIGGA